MFKHTRSSAPNIFAKFGWQIQTFCHKKMKKIGCQTRVRQTIVGCIWMRATTLGFAVPVSDHIKMYKFNCP